MIKPVPPALIFIAGALVLPLLKIRILKQFFQLALPVAAFINLLYMNEGVHWTFNFIGYEIIFGRVDKLSLCFGYVFVIMAFLGMLYALHVKQDGQHTAAFLYMGSTLGVVFAGDLFSLFVFWEFMAVSSTFLIWFQKEKASLDSGFRYILIHLMGGTILLAGIVLYAGNSGSISFNAIEFGSPASVLILLGFIINAAVPPFHAWLTDSYPMATITGSVFLTAFTTKSAVYVLLRGFPGVDLLVWLGAIMALYGVVYAVLENNIRRLLAYHIISQVGYMVCGVGLGTEMAINGSAAHAFSHILYKALLFMGVGAVIYSTGYNKMTELQGNDLYKKMPVTLILYMIGGFSISAVPLFNGFVSKTMVVAAAGEVHRPVIHLMLHLASIGTFLHTGLKLPYGIWFGRRTKDSIPEIQTKALPLNMLLAMGMTAFFCIITGVYPHLLYNLLPYPVHYHPYTPYYVVAMIQLLLFTTVAFWLYRHKLGGEATISLDTDWFYRKAGGLFVDFCNQPLNTLRIKIRKFVSYVVEFITGLAKNPFTAPKVALWRTRIGLSYLFVMMGGNQKATLYNKYKRRLNYLEKTAYDENCYRFPVGFGVIFVLIFFLLWTLINLYRTS